MALKYTIRDFGDNVMASARTLVAAQKRARRFRVPVRVVCAECDGEKLCAECRSEIGTYAPTHGGRRPGAGRPRIGPEVKIDLPPALIASYDALAERRGQTRAAAMREALTAWLAMEAAADRLGR